MEINVNVPFNRLIITTKTTVTESGIETKSMDDKQTVLAIGPGVKESPLIEVEVGDEIIIDTSELMRNPKAEIGLTIPFNKKKGVPARIDDKSDDIEFVKIIDSRQVLLVIPK